MRWKAKPEKDPYDWEKKFALLPRKIDGYWIWLEEYEQRMDEHLSIFPYSVALKYRLPTKQSGDATVS